MPDCMKFVLFEMWHPTLSASSVDTVAGSSGASSHFNLNGSTQTSTHSPQTDKIYEHALVSHTGHHVSLDEFFPGWPRDITQSIRDYLRITFLRVWTRFQYFLRESADLSTWGQITLLSVNRTQHILDSSAIASGKLGKLGEGLP